MKVFYFKVRCRIQIGFFILWTNRAGFPSWCDCLKFDNPDQLTFDKWHYVYETLSVTQTESLLCDGCSRYAMTMTSVCLFHGNLLSLFRIVMNSNRFSSNLMWNVFNGTGVFWSMIFKEIVYLRTVIHKWLLAHIKPFAIGMDEQTTCQSVIRSVIIHPVCPLRYCCLAPDSLFNLFPHNWYFLLHFWDYNSFTLPLIPTVFSFSKMPRFL